MNKKILLITFSFTVVAIFSGYKFINNKNNQINEPLNFKKSIQLAESNFTKIIDGKIILFYGDGCPHCALVEKYIEENKISSKIEIEKKEIYKNKQNANELKQQAKICGISTSSIGVPLLWNGVKCFVGDQDIISFFKSKTSNLE